MGEGKKGRNNEGKKEKETHFSYKVKTSLGVRKHSLFLISPGLGKTIRNSSPLGTK